MREDCFYFMTSNCARGMNCAYRHSQEAKHSQAVCNNWKNGLDCDESCPNKHSDYQVKEKPTVECYWETHGGCRKADCPYVHKQKQKVPMTNKPPCLLDIQKLNYDLEKLNIKECHENKPIVVKNIGELMKELKNIEEIFHI
ncbi:hypothetical protein NERG_00927 [Nematocida ausubeli]|uniref:C3H1-type domain-containing protein n=1 Tax=Nematocida ausubeli (strain ATCC PRA-371 / ERTm2) TaxID=1913371 RepID=H8ZBH8_NEMA1|nr:hypothetical protein NERG_00927 [Nematocida ausubeli]KAI5137476.1 hypothetical protein NEAUS06_2254 [Nematocida ausubeli]